MLRDKLRSNSPLANCIVVGITDEITGESPWAFVTLMPGADLTLEDERRLAKNCVIDIGEHAMPSRFVTIKEIPETMTGKYMR